MAEVTGLVAVEPFVGDTPETLGTRSCDLCGWSLGDGPPQRDFWYDLTEHLSVCGECLDEYLAETPG